MVLTSEESEYHRHSFAVIAVQSTADELTRVCWLVAACSVEMRQVEEERQHRKHKMNRLLAKVKDRAGDSTASSPPTTCSHSTTSATSPLVAAAASSPSSSRLMAVSGKRAAAHARSSSATLSLPASAPSTSSQRAPTTSLSATANSAFVLAVQKREEEASQRKQAAALRRKQKEDEARAQLQRKQAEQQQRKQDEAKSLTVKQHDEQAKQRAMDEVKQRQRELQREKMALACMHHSYALMRWTGWEGWRRYVRCRKDSERTIAERGEQKRVLRLWRLWRRRVEQRKAEEAREEERKMVKAADHRQRYLQARAFQPWQRLTVQHFDALRQGDAHYQQSVQRFAYLLWLCRMRAAVAANEERLRGLEVRAVVMGERHLLRFWLLKWKHAQALAREEKQVSVDFVHTCTCNVQARRCVLTHLDDCRCMLSSIRSGELKEETWKKVNGWLSSYRAQKQASSFT